MLLSHLLVIIGLRAGFWLKKGFWLRGENLKKNSCVLCEASTLLQDHVQLNHSLITTYGDLDNQKSSHSTLGGHGLTVWKHNRDVEIQRKLAVCTEDWLPAAGLAMETLKIEVETSVRL